MTEGELKSICSQLSSTFEKFAEYQKAEIQKGLLLSQEIDDSEIFAARIKFKYLDELISSINNASMENE